MLLPGDRVVLLPDLLTLFPFLGSNGCPIFGRWVQLVNLFMADPIPETTVAPLSKPLFLQLHLSFDLLILISDPDRPSLFTSQVDFQRFFFFPFLIWDFAFPNVVVLPGLLHLPRCRRWRCRGRRGPRRRPLRGSWVPAPRGEVREAEDVGSVGPLPPHEVESGLARQRV